MEIKLVSVAEPYALKWTAYFSLPAAGVDFIGGCEPRSPEHTRNPLNWRTRLK
jgi:hypothetical protein